MRWQWALVPAGLIGGCWLDTAGLKDDQPTPGTTTTNTTTNTTTDTTTGTFTGSTTTTTTSAGGGGGGGSGPVCNDGIVEPPEQCEDGDALDGDGCSATCTTEATCDNSVIEPGEECDSSIECAGCVVQSPSPCVGATNISIGNFSGDTTGLNQTTFGAPGTDFHDDCSDYTQAPFVLYRHDVGPYPEGLAVFARGTGGSFDDAFVWSYVGCGAEPAACSDDGGQLADSADAAMLTPVLSPHTVVYVAIADFDSGETGTFQATARTFRYGAWFPHYALNPSFVLTGDWHYAANNQLVINSHTAANQDTATSPPFYVAGLDDLQLTFQHRLDVDNGTSASVEVSFDSGSWQPTSFYGVSNDDTDREFNTANIAVPSGTREARFRFVFSDDDNSNGGWAIGGVLAGRPL